MRSTDAKSIAMSEGQDQAREAWQSEGSRFQPYQAPGGHGESLIAPPLSQVGALLRSNRQLLARQTVLESLRREARQQLLADAIRYTSTYRDLSWLDETSDTTNRWDRPILMAGHQPALFHAGVWFKNFALSRLAQQTSSIAVNLVIDNDVASGSSIRVPTLDGDRGLVTYRSIPYDRAGGGVPYEQTTIGDRQWFDTFDQRVAQTVAPLVKDPCVWELWHHARRAVQRCGVAGCAVAQARHGLEGEIGLRTLELPLGVVCRTAPFAEFVLMILVELPRFRHCYNGAAEDYRRAHHIRSSAHPVPNLSEDGEWFEAPLWIYGNDAPQRRSAWVRMIDDEIVISDRAGREIRLDTRFPKLAAEQLSRLLGPNFKLRPRALLTTMYARLVLSDLFLHGIGGGKYDQLGDRIVQAFFMAEPPQFMVISATVLLPGVLPQDSALAIRQLQRAIRDTEFQPERFATQVPMDPMLLEQKRALLASFPPPGERGEWTRELGRVNRVLSKSLAGRRGELREELMQQRRRAASQRTLASREHPFCVFPLDYLVETYHRILDAPMLTEI